MKQLRDGDLFSAEEKITKFPFQTFGPFPIERRALLSQEAAAEFWDDIEEKHAKLRDAIGIYIFAIKATKRSSLVPWYVGKTDSGFEKRFRARGKLFKDLVSKKGPVSVFLIARSGGSRGGLMRPRKNLASINILETMLIERCLDVNSRLLNASKVKHVKGLIVPGFKNEPKGKPNAAALQLSAMLGKKVSKEF